jgi:hypothetical protein
MMEPDSTSFTPYDLIGDIHGHADELTTLLESMGYARHDGHYTHPAGRQAIFLGDYIDRGPEIRRVLEIVRGMIEAGSANAILGNHEINALRFHTIGSSGQPLRPHWGTNLRQHQSTLEQFPDVEEWAAWLNWLAGLPLFLDLGGIRAVHACWDQRVISDICSIGRLEGEVLENHSIKGTAGYEKLSRLVNGPEALLPEGFSHRTADGRTRKEFRVKWWQDISAASCREAVFPETDAVPDILPQRIPATGYPEDAPPTFFGHYALKGSVPQLIRPNLACLDYGMGKGGFLCAYRWDGEAELDPSKLLTVAAQSLQTAL